MVLIPIESGEHTVKIPVNDLLWKQEFPQNGLRLAPAHGLTAADVFRDAIENSEFYSNCPPANPRQRACPVPGNFRMTRSICRTLLNSGDRLTAASDTDRSVLQGSPESARKPLLLQNWNQVWLQSAAADTVTEML